MTPKTLKQLFYDNFEITVTKKHFIELRKVVNEFEVRQSHLDALNTAMLGLDKMYFLPKDFNALFNIFNIDPIIFKKVAHSADAVVTSRHVTSDIYNILTVWITHRVIHSDLSIRDKHEMQVLLFKMLHYKFFTSIVNHQLRYGADEPTMRYTIDNLSGKFFIKQDDTPTWYAVIAKRSYDIVDPNSIHAKTFKTFTPDDKGVLYVLSDTQTRIRKQLITIIQKFHLDKKHGRKITSSSIVSSIDGEKIINAISSSLDNTISTTISSALNINEFIDPKLINVTIALNKNIKANMLNSLLIKFSQVATQQQANGDSELIKGTGSSQIIYGYKELIRNIIQKTYRLCTLDKDVDVKSRVEILNKTRTTYASSRISDKDVLIIKNSVDAFVNTYSDSKRPSTNASLKISFLIYIMLISMKYM